MKLVIRRAPLALAAMSTVGLGPPTLASDAELDAGLGISTLRVLRGVMDQAHRDLAASA